MTFDLDTLIEVNIDFLRDRLNRTGGPGPGVAVDLNSEAIGSPYVGGTGYLPSIEAARLVAVDLMDRAAAIGLAVLAEPGAREATCRTEPTEAVIPWCHLIEPVDEDESDIIGSVTWAGEIYAP